MKTLEDRLVEFSYELRYLDEKDLILEAVQKLRYIQKQLDARDRPVVCLECNQQIADAETSKGTVEDLLPTQWAGKPIECSGNRTEGEQ